MKKVVKKLLAGAGYALQRLAPHIPSGHGTRVGSVLRRRARAGQGFSRRALIAVFLRASSIGRYGNR
jgi:hypothetical protein